jgi:hypothetical protein
VTNLPRRAQRAEASPIIACGPKHGESGAVRYFRMGAVAVEIRHRQIFPDGCRRCGIRHRQVVAESELRRRLSA